MVQDSGWGQTDRHVGVEAYKEFGLMNVREFSLSAKAWEPLIESTQANNMVAWCVLLRWLGGSSSFHQFASLQLWTHRVPSIHMEGRRRGCKDSCGWNACLIWRHFHKTTCTLTMGTHDPTEAAWKHICSIRLPRLGMGAAWFCQLDTNLNVSGKRRSC